ncbi:MAG: hypothetical protein GEV07_03990 [Streptosporangiales bacterium]|nr:hypothetical protein [Streptosporangiales bacterium]
MPHVTVHLCEDLLDDDSSRAIIHHLTEAVAGVAGGWARPLVVVELFGVPRAHWGLGGTPAVEHVANVTLAVRDRAFDDSVIPDAAARFIAAITDGMLAALGEGIRKNLNVLTLGVPSGRSGVGGEVATWDSTTPSPVP